METAKVETQKPLHRFGGAISRLVELAETCERNAPIYFEEGNVEQSALSASNATEYRAAIRYLQGAPFAADAAGVSLTTLMAKVAKVEYTALQDGRTTICLLTMQNGCTVVGQSVSAPTTVFNAQAGETYAYDDALAKAWPLEVYLLEERKHQEAS